MYCIIFLASMFLVFIGQIAMSQNYTQNSPSSDSTETINITIDGCLSKDNESGRLILADVAKDGGAYYLIGHTAELNKYIGGELKVAGRKDTPPTPSSGSNPIPLKVKSWEVIIDPNKEIPPNIDKVADWKSFVNREYGISIRLPKTFEVLEGSNNDSYQDSEIESNFTEEEGQIRLFSLAIPRDIYGSHTTFTGGKFSVYVNPEINNTGMCKLFKETRGKITSRTINGITYTETHVGSAGLGHCYDSGFLHTYQNVLCYAFDFEFGDVKGAYYGSEQYCTMDGKYNTDKLIDLLLSNVSFSKPTLKKRSAAIISAPPDAQTICANFKRNFTGTIGTNIKANWHLTLENANLSGTEQYARIGKNLWLKGVVDSDGNFIIEERYPKDQIAGIFAGKFSESCQQMTGYFSKPDGSRLQPFEFRETGADN